MTDKSETQAFLPDESGREAKWRALEGELRGERRGRRRATRGLIAALALLVLGTGVAWATGAFSANDISYKAGVGCYSEARLHGPRLSIAITHAAADPVAKCEKYWREGVIDTTLRRLGREGKIDYPEPGPYPPHLVACAKPGSAIYVFPGPDDTCTHLGLEPLPADYAPKGREAARAYTAWDRVVIGKLEVHPGACESPTAVARKVMKLLADSQYSDVRVIVSKKGPCAESVESSGRVIVVRSVGRGGDRARAGELDAGGALLWLFETATIQCISPSRFAGLARETLAEAGLRRVTVKVSRGSEPCTSGSWGSGPRQVMISGSSLKEWRGNKKTTSAYRRRHHPLELADQQRQILVVLEPLNERATLHCIPPESFGRSARRELARAELPRATVGVHQRALPCALGVSGVALKSLEANVSAQSRSAWQLNRKMALRHLHMEPDEETDIAHASN